MRFARVWLLLAIAACANGHNAIGDQDGPCYQNDTCNAGLTCVNNTCIAVDAGTPIDAKANETPDAAPDGPTVIPDSFIPDSAVVPDAFIPDAAVTVDAGVGAAVMVDAAVDAAVMVDAAVDAAVTPDAPTTCDPLAQTGCQATEKCTWVDDGTGANGRNQCVPNGTVALGGACTFTGGANDYDNCVRGEYCTNGTCETICNPAGGTPMCDAQHACQVYDGVFGVSGSETGGVCDPSCNPLNDNDFDGSGTAHSKPGTACTSDPTIGCYGVPSYTKTTHFSCASPAGATALTLHHRNVITGTAFLNSCAPGYEIAFSQDATGSNNVDCYAFCRPGDAYLNNPATQLPNGSSPHGCNTTDALGNFGAKPTAVNNGTNGEHCMYSWFFEIDDAGNYLPSATSNSVGICWDHTKYKYDSNGDGTADKTIEACTTLPLTSTTGVNAVTWGCVSTITGNFGFTGKPGKRPYVEGMPELLMLRNR